MVGLTVAAFSGLITVVAIVLLRLEERRRAKRQGLKRKARA